MGVPIPMPIDTFDETALLTLAQWFSPSFPVGAFSYSHGLEWAVHVGDVSTVNDFQTWLSDAITCGSGRNDLILLAETYRAGPDAHLDELDALARALCPSAERLLETCQQGAAFSQAVSGIWTLDLGDLTYPVAVGAAARRAHLPLDQTARFFLHAFAGNLTSAAIRLVPLGQTEGQTALAALTPLINETATLALSQTRDHLGSTAFLIDIASMRHETQYSRMFRS